MGVAVITAPTKAEILALVTVEKLKASKRITHNAEDALLADFLVDAFQWFDGPEGWLRRAILPQTWRYTRKCFTGLLELPGSPLRSVESVGYLDSNLQALTVDPAGYSAITIGHPFGMLYAGSSWPITAVGHPGGVTINFTAGWDAPNASGGDILHGQVPGPVVRAIYLLAGSLYEHREADMEDNRISAVSRKIEYGIEKLAARWRILNDPAGSF